MELIGGSLEFLAAVILMLVGLTYSVYSRTGSGINFHPFNKNYTDAPGAQRASAISGRDGIVHMTSRGTR